MGIVENSRRLVACSKILDIPLIVSEQYPKGLGTTVSELDIGNAALKYEKTQFTMWLPEVKEFMKNGDVIQNQINTVVLFGIETHVCVQQTALDLISDGYEVIVIADATSSRSLV